MRRLTFSEATMETLKRWVGMRQDACPFMFITRRGVVISQASKSVFNHWAANVFSKIAGRRVTPHSLRSARATILSEEEKKPAHIIQKLLGHERLNTTTDFYIVRDDSDDLDELYVI